MPEPTRQSLCCSQPQHGPTLRHQMSQGRKKHMAPPGLEPRTSRRQCEYSDHWAIGPHGRPVTHIQTKVALVTCIIHCHLLELTLLYVMDLWKLDESISNFKGAWCIYFYFISYRNTCTCMQRVKILIIRRILRRLIRACTVCLCPFLQDTMHK